MQFIYNSPRVDTKTIKHNQTLFSVQLQIKVILPRAQLKPEIWIISIIVSIQNYIWGVEVTGNGCDREQPRTTQVTHHQGSRRKDTETQKTSDKIHIY